MRFRFYHGTTLPAACRILREGLKRPSSGTGRRVWTEYAREDCVYASTSLDNAMAWADIAGRRFRERPAVVGIRDIPPECTVHYDPHLWGSERMICGCDIPPEYIDPVWARGYPVGVKTPFRRCS